MDSCPSECGRSKLKDRPSLRGVFLFILELPNHHDQGPSFHVSHHINLFIQRSRTDTVDRAGAGMKEHREWFALFSRCCFLRDAAKSTNNDNVTCAIMQ